MTLCMAMEGDAAVQRFHEYIDANRLLIDGLDPLQIPESHRGLKVGENHEGSQRLAVRVAQGASWLGNAEIFFSVSPGGIEERDEASSMARFARFGEQRLGRGTPLHTWKQETYRDFFECGLSVIQQNPRADYYLGVRDDPQKLVEGTRLEDVVWRRRVDPRSFYWSEDGVGGFDATLIRAQKQIRDIVRVSDRSALARISTSVPWAETALTDPWRVTGQTTTVRELWVADRGYLVVWGPYRNLRDDDPSRIVSRWRNQVGHPPYYLAGVGIAPWRSPLDEMFALTNERNYWSTMLDLQAAGAIFRHWQLIDDATGDSIQRSIWQNPVPENQLLDMTKPPPDMGPGTKWELAPYEFHDVLPRYQQIVMQHEAAGASVSRLMGQDVGQYTAVGTADMLEEYARREFADGLESFEDAYSRLWEDFFRWERVHHPDPIFVSARTSDVRGTKSLEFFDSRLVLTGSDIVSEDVRVRLDTRSRLSKIADYQQARLQMNNGDLDFERAVENGAVPWVEDAKEEVARITVSQGEKMNIELQLMALQKQTAENLGLVEQPEVAPPNVTRGARTDPRGSGVGKGPDNISDTAMRDGGMDAGRVA
jgi:hypothetical protein